MQLLEALHAASQAIQHRGTTIYEVAYRSRTVGTEAYYTVKRYPASQRTGPIVRALAELTAIAAFVHRDLALDPDAWEPAVLPPARGDAPTLQQLLQLSSGAGALGTPSSPSPEL